MELLEKESDLKYNAAVMRERREYVPSSLEELSKEENAEKEKLLLSGFNDWTRNDFAVFVRGCERFGRTDIFKITEVR